MKLKVGTALTLEPTYTDRVEKFFCKVIGQDKNRLYIDYPINAETNKTAYLVDGSQFRATLIAPDNVTYAFNTEVVGRKLDNIPLIKLTCPPEEEFIKIQRRQYVRVKTEADVAVEFNNTFSQLVTCDISAGGLAVYLKNNVPLKGGAEVRLTIVLPFMNGEIRYVQTHGKVVRVFEKNQIQLASIQFIDIGQLERQYIVRFCFERQLMARRKYETYTTV